MVGGAGGGWREMRGRRPFRCQYACSRALAEDLEAFADDRPVAARPISMLERLQKSIRRNRAFFALTTVVVSTLLVIGLAFGAVTVFNIQRTSATIRDQDELASLEQAATLERAIRVNMLQGRADVVRELKDEARAAGEDVVAAMLQVAELVGMAAMAVAVVIAAAGIPVRPFPAAGVAARSATAERPVVTATDVVAVVAFLETLRGTNPPNPKAPEGAPHKPSGDSASLGDTANDG